MKHIAAVCAAAAAVAITASGCTMQARRIAPTPQVIRQIGLPVYPNSKPWFGQDTSESLRSVEIHQLSASFETSDDLGRVQRFYADRLPKNTRRIEIPLGFTRTIAFQFYDKTSQKQVTLISVKGKMIIQLRSMTLSSATASPQAVQR